MKIGEFAQAAGLPISMLRHYDKEGLLSPDYIDAFTGYRYYSCAQLERVHRIALLKQAGLSLKEIKNILGNPHDHRLIRSILDGHSAEYRNMLVSIEEVRQIMLNKQEATQIQTQNKPGESPVFIEKEGDTILFKSQLLPQPIDRESYKAAQKLLDMEIRKRDYQRISGFLTYGAPGSSDIRLAARAVQLNTVSGSLAEDINVPFVDDEQVVGKWKILGEYAVAEDFLNPEGFEPRNPDFATDSREIYFLPGGEKYWIFGWTRGFLTVQTRNVSSLNPYSVRERDGRRYMLVEYKSYESRRGGQPVILVLEQLDNKAYTISEIARKDSVDLPFINDERVLGDWTAVDFIERPEDFAPNAHHLPQDTLYFKHMRFDADGAVTNQYADKTISGKNMVSWTKGCLLNHYCQTSHAYRIETVEGRDYLIIEWKSGDWRFGGRETDYYVFTRA